MFPKTCKNQPWLCNLCKLPPYGKVFVYLVPSYKKLLPSILQASELELTELESALALQPLQTCEIVVR
jgi:hypothetical protein